MSALSDARADAAKKAVIDSGGDVSKAHVKAEEYYSAFIGRVPTMNEVHDLAELVESMAAAHKKKLVDADAERYRAKKG